MRRHWTHFGVFDFESGVRRISPYTVKKELRHLHAALGVAKRWDYLREIPPIPRVASDERDKPHVTEAHFLAMLKHADVANMPSAQLHKCFVSFRQ